MTTGTKRIVILGVPTLCAYGVYDKVCPFGTVRHLLGALEEYNVPHDYIEFPHSRTRATGCRTTTTWGGCTTKRSKNTLKLTCSDRGRCAG